MRQKDIITDSRCCTSIYADLLVESPCLDTLHWIGNVVNCSSWCHFKSLWLAQNMCTKWLASHKKASTSVKKLAGFSFVGRSITVPFSRLARVPSTTVQAFHWITWIMSNCHVDGRAGKAKFSATSSCWTRSTFTNRHKISSSAYGQPCRMHIGAFNRWRRVCRQSRSALHCYEVVFGICPAAAIVCDVTKL